MNYYFLIPNNLIKIIKERLLSKTDIENYISEIIVELSLEDYLKEIVVSNEKISDFACYNCYDKSITIYTNTIKLNSLMILNTNNLNVDKTLFINLMIIQNIVHELIHIIQICSIKEQTSDLLNLYKYELDFFLDKNNDKLYNNYYPCIVYEREAIVQSFTIVLRIIQKHFYSDKLFNYFANELIKFMVTGYENNESPNEILFNEIFKQEVPILSNINLFNQIMLGNKITKEELSSFISNSKNLILKQIQ